MYKLSYVIRISLVFAPSYGDVSSLYLKRKINDSSIPSLPFTAYSAVNNYS